MKAVLQRVKYANVVIDGVKTAGIGPGILVLLGVKDGDTEAECDVIAAKLPKLRIFSDADDKMNLSVADIGGEILVVSNFTLCAETRRGNRPDFFPAARPEVAEPLYERAVASLRSVLGEARVKTGVFGADMKLELLNDGPVTLILDSAELTAPKNKKSEGEGRTP